jgi:adenylylsulfate kinase
MIILLYGQPASGKTTLAKEIKKRFLIIPILIDGDKWRDVTKNKDYSKEGRLRNLKGAFDMGLYLEKEGYTPVLSFVTPYEELRSYLKDNAQKTFFIYLKYDEDRGRNQNFANDFEEGSYDLQLDTSKQSIEESINEIKAKYLTIIK